MKYLSLLLFVTFSLGCVNSYAQSTEKTNKISLKLYSQVMANKSEGSKLSLGITPAVSLATKNGNFHELQLSDILISREKNNTKYGSSTQLNKKIGIRYSFNYALNNKGKLRVYAGAGANSNLHSYKYKYNSPGLMDMAEKGEYTRFTTDIDLNITPRLIWNISNKWFVDVNVPVSVFNYTNSIEQIDDVQQKIKTNSNSTFPNKYTVNVGLGFKF